MTAVLSGLGAVSYQADLLCSSFSPIAAKRDQCLRMRWRCSQVQGSWRYPISDRSLPAVSRRNARAGARAVCRTARAILAWPASAVLLSIADAIRYRRPISIRYTAGDGRRSARTLHPYGLVAHSGRWYVTGAEPEIGEDRTFRLDRIADARTLPGSFEPPAGLDPTQRVLSGFAEAPYRHEVTLRIQGTVEQIRARLPASVAIVAEPPAASCADAETERWLRVELRVERLDWLPPVLASLDRPFAIERPDELRGLVVALAERLVTSARRSPPHV